MFAGLLSPGLLHLRSVCAVADAELSADSLHVCLFLPSDNRSETDSIAARRRLVSPSSDSLAQ